MATGAMRMAKRRKEWAEQDGAEAAEKADPQLGAGVDPEPGKRGKHAARSDAALKKATDDLAALQKLYNQLMGEALVWKGRAEWMAERMAMLQAQLMQLQAQMQAHVQAQGTSLPS